jgi:hypothetical protein
MTNILEIETCRQIEQERLDSLKDAEERNRCGQFATPLALALDIAKYVWDLWKKRSDKVNFLDPAIGTGAFYSALCQVFPSDLITRAVGIELDPHLAEVAASLWKPVGLTVRIGDFTKQNAPNPDQRFNLICANPPYVRHHHLSREEKGRLKALIARNLRIRVSGLAGLYCYFLLICDNWLAEDGLAIWLIPSEFMDVNYGAAVKRYLTENVKLLHVHRFSPSDVQFSNALVSSTIVIFQKSTPPPNHEVLFSLGGSLLKPDIKKYISLSNLQVARKWTAYPLVYSGTKPYTLTFGDLFTIKRGLATGANSFFILPKSEALHHGIPIECLKPILPSPRYLPDGIIESGEEGYPVIKRPLSLIDCTYPEEEICERFPRFWAYLQAGKEKGIHTRYLTSRRSPWYSQEKRLPAPFLCTYMGRGQDESRPFRFFWNKSAAIAPNVYLMLYSKDPLKKALDLHPEFYQVIFSLLQQIDMNKCKGEGRVYGGGLYKMEPNELARLSAEPFLTALKSLNVGQVEQLAGEPQRPLILEADRQLSLELPERALKGE